MSETEAMTVDLTLGTSAWTPRLNPTLTSTVCAALAYHNFFQPVMRLQAKLSLTPLHYRRRYDQAKTPSDRLKEQNSLTDEVRLRLENLRE